LNSQYYKFGAVFPALRLKLLSKERTFYQLTQVSHRRQCYAISDGTPQRAETGSDKHEQLLSSTAYEVNMSKILDARFPRDKVSPHCCSSCGSGEHLVKGCNRTDTLCVYPRCLERGHVLAVCPVLMARCPKCQRLGHLQEQCTTIPWMLLMNDFRAACPFHRMGIFATERLTASMYKEDGDKFAVLPKVDYENKTYVTFWDRFRLSVLPYDLPY
jgi:hypothetical protein